MALVNGGFLHYTDMKKLLKRSSLKPLIRFLSILTEMFLEGPFSEIVREILIRH